MTHDLSPSLSTRAAPPRQLALVRVARCAVASRRASPRDRAADAAAPDFTLRTHERPEPAPAGAARPGRDGELLGHLVRPVPPGDAAARPLYEKYRASGFVLLGVNVDDDPQQGRPTSPPSSASRFPVLLDTDKTVSKLYDLSTMPSTVIIDRDGKVRYVHRGYLDRLRGQLRKADPGVAEG